MTFSELGCLTAIILHAGTNGAWSGNASLLASNFPGTNTLAVQKIIRSLRKKGYIHCEQKNGPGRYLITVADPYFYKGE
jgi:hypothetical protein